MNNNHNVAMVCLFESGTILRVGVAVKGKHDRSHARHGAVKHKHSPVWHNFHEITGMKCKNSPV